MSHGAKILILAVAVLGTVTASALEDKGPRGAWTYLAPEGPLLFGLHEPDGGVRYFERDFSHPGVLRSGDGWTGRMEDDGRITVRGPSRGKATPDAMTFFRGRLVSLTRRGKTSTFASDKPPPTIKAVPADEQPVFDSNEADLMWGRSGRLRFPFANPNQNGGLYAVLAVFLLGLLPRCRRRAARYGVLLSFAVLSFLTAMTASRGAFVGLGAGCLIVFAFSFRAMVRDKALWTVLGLAVLAAGCWFMFHDSSLLTRGFGTSNSWSNQLRREFLSIAPKMMADASSGWGFCGAGRAYMDWYQPLAFICYTGSLMNDHLTFLVEHGWVLRFLYLLLWCCGLSALVVMACRRGDTALPLAVWISFGLAACFNPLFEVWAIWLVPILSLVPFVRAAPWRCVRSFGLSLGVGLILAVGLTVFLWEMGSLAADRKPRVRTMGSAVAVNGNEPKIWIVDDGVTLGGVLAAKDVRQYYAYVPTAPAVGFVRDIRDLPTRVPRLVLAGHAAEAWMERICGDEQLRENLPESVLLLSPPFPPRAIPLGLLQKSRVTYVIGEFAARKFPEFQTAVPRWVKVVPGMDRYILRWMSLAMGD